jgi:hypothetical protein
MQDMRTVLLSMALLLDCGLAFAQDGNDLRSVVAEQQKVVEQFFGQPMPHPFELRIFREKSEMNEFVRKQWQMPELPCSAVAMGAGSALAVLSPAVWKTQACEHDPADHKATEKLLARELVHVFHGQNRPDDSEFMRAGDARWFVEGLAVYVSGQLDPARLKQAADLVRAGKAPTKLAEAWSGEARDAVAGSIVKFLAKRIGRTKLTPLLPMSTTAEIMAAVGMQEDEFLKAWRNSLQ